MLPRVCSGVELIGGGCCGGGKVEYVRYSLVLPRKERRKKNNLSIKMEGVATGDECSLLKILVMPRVSQVVEGLGALISNPWPYSPARFKRNVRSSSC